MSKNVSSSTPDASLGLGQAESLTLIKNRVDNKDHVTNTFSGNTVSGSTANTRKGDRSARNGDRSFGNGDRSARNNGSSTRNNGSRYEVGSKDEEKATLIFDFNGKLGKKDNVNGKVDLEDTTISGKNTKIGNKNDSKHTTGSKSYDSKLGNTSFKKMKNSKDDKIDTKSSSKKDPKDDTTTTKEEKREPTLPRGFNFTATREERRLQRELLEKNGETLPTKQVDIYGRLANLPGTNLKPSADLQSHLRGPDLLAQFQSPINKSLSMFSPARHSMLMSGGGQRSSNHTEGTSMSTPAGMSTPGGSSSSNGAHNSYAHDSVVYYLNAVFKNVQSGFLRDFGFGRNDNVVKSSIEIDAGNLGYGEVTFSGMEPLYKAFKLKPSDVFYDLGSGTGKLTLYVACRNEVVRSVGLELGEKRHKAAFCAGTRVRKDLIRYDQLAGEDELSSPTGKSGIHTGIEKTKDVLDPLSGIVSIGEKTPKQVQSASIASAIPSPAFTRVRTQGLTKNATKTGSAGWDHTRNNSFMINKKSGFSDRQISADTGFSDCRSFYSHPLDGNADGKQDNMGIFGSSTSGSTISATTNENTITATVNENRTWCAPFEFHRRDICQEHYSNTKVSVVYLSNLLMDAGVESRCLEALLRAPSFRRLITGTPVHHPKLKKIGNVRYSATWAKVTSATIYEVVR